MTYLGDWKDSGLEGLCGDFGINPDELKGLEVVVAGYFYGSYEGSSYVLLRSKSGDLFEVHSSHCSCYGLEGSWKLESISPEALEHRVQRADFSYLAEPTEREAIVAAIRSALP